MQLSNIQWCTHVMNFIGGCTPISPGCENCWAARLASGRLKNNPLYKGTATGGKWTGRVRVMPELISCVRGEPKKIFWNSTADMFHKDVSFEAVDVAFEAMFNMPMHTHLILTKRVKRMAEYINRLPKPHYKPEHPFYWSRKPNPNIHLGVSICNQKEADEILPIALQIPGFDFISFEPLLGPIDFNQDYCDGKFWGRLLKHIIIGCESGTNRRPCSLDWIKQLIQQGKAAYDTKVFVKQIDTRELRPLGVLNCKVSHDPTEWPKWVRVREPI